MRDKDGPIHNDTSTTFDHLTSTGKSDLAAEDNYDFEGARNYIIVTVLVYSLFGLCGIILHRMGRRARVFHNAQERSAFHTGTFLANLEKVRLQEWKNKMRIEKQRATTVLANFDTKFRDDNAFSDSIKRIILDKRKERRVHKYLQSRCNVRDGGLSPEAAPLWISPNSENHVLTLIPEETEHDIGKSNLSLPGLVVTIV